MSQSKDVTLLETVENQSLASIGADDVDGAVAALMHHVGDRVRQVRKAQRMSRRALSERSGVSPRYLAKLEGGEGNISIGLLKKLALALDTPIALLVMDEDGPATDSRQMLELYARADAETRARVLHVLDPERMRAQKAQRLCLVGLRGAGKSTLGALVADTFDATFVELNREVEQNAGMPVAEIIAFYGQEGYRQLEADTLAGIIETHQRAVVAVAGGIVSEQDTYAQVLSRFHTVWIKASAGEHMDRVRAQGDLRPMKGNPRAMIQLRQILKSREALYAQADHVLDTNGKSVAASHAELSDLIEACQILNAPVA